MQDLAALPLSRFKVLDLTRARAGPTCVRQLVDWGAEAVKIEMPGGRAGDGMGGARDGFDFQNLHRNKQGITLNLKCDEGVALFKRMVAQADVVVENYRPDVKKRLGIDYESIQAINPRIVYGSISGFGQDGPYKDRPGVDQIAQGIGGLMSITGLPGQGPVRVGIPITDLCAGIFLAQGILVALLDREVTGKGRWVTTSLLESMLSMLDFQAARWLIKGEVPPQAGNNHPTAIPTGVFKTSDGHINIAAGGGDMYRRLCNALGLEALIEDARFRNQGARQRNRDELNALIEQVTVHKTMAEWIPLLNKAGVPCGPIYTIDRTFADEQVRHLDMAKPVRSARLGELKVVGHPVKFGDVRNEIRLAAPDLAQDNMAFYTGLGFSREQIADMEQRGII
ncbi:MAG: CoA transferase [Candidatus Lambdaproteobacteria bacterium]|nr:CoA transferase [Candidatus Lambdaproteobacteria bacterium]